VAKPVYFIVETQSADALVSLAGRILAYAALDRHSSVLFRLGGTVWTQAQELWPAPSDSVADWLQRQEFSKAADYWHMTVLTAAPKLYLCSGSIPTETEWPNGYAEHSLTGFLADADEHGADAVWI
jgi:hypothetical protein